MRHLFSLNRYFLRYKRHLIFGLLFILLTNYFRILVPQVTGYVVDSVVLHLKHDDVSVRLHESKHFDYGVHLLVTFLQSFDFSSRILYSGITLLLLAITSGFFMFLMRQTIIVMSRHIEYEQKNDIYDHYQKLDLGFFKSNTTGDLMNRISEDVSRVRMYTGPALMYFVNLAAVIGFSVYFMFAADPVLTFYALSPLPVLAVAIYFVNSIINKKSETIQENLSALTSVAQETYSGIRVIKSFVQERAMTSFFRENAEKYRQSALSLARSEAVFFPSMALLIGLSTLITIMKGGMDVVNHVEGASVGKIASFVLYIQMLTWPVSLIGWTVSMVQRAAASQKRINEFLHLKPGIQNSPVAVPADFSGDICFEHVSFTYQNTGIRVLDDFTLRIRKGEKIIVMGKTGSGKTTLAMLLMRMYDPDEGIISVSNLDIRKTDIQSLRAGVSYVPQDLFLFSDTIAGNIRFGRLDADETDIRKAAADACLLDEIMKFPDGFQTMLGERGVNLSGGQKQRLSIARAIIRDAGILVLDDCLSAVDTRTENILIGHLNRYLENKTAIITSHRILTGFKADKIVVIDEGKIVEMGTSEELLRRKGYYYSIHAKQQGIDNE